MFSVYSGYLGVFSRMFTVFVKETYIPGMLEYFRKFRNKRNARGNSVAMGVFS